MIQGVLFDMDGLMFDTERIGREGWFEAARRLKLPVTEQLIAKLRGTGVSECRVIFNSEIPGGFYDTARAIRLEYEAASVARDGLPVKPGLYELLEWLRQERIPAALATSTGREKALGYLEKAGVSEYFTAVTFGTEVPNPKPAPDIFLAAAAQLHAAPAGCVVLEDSPNGLRAAKAAGCKAVVIPDLTPAPQASERLWDAQAATLAEAIPILKRLHEIHS